jgi:hypothetical protein
MSDDAMNFLFPPDSNFSGGWIRFQSYPSAGDWHAASAILRRAGIPTRMVGDPAGRRFGMLVPVDDAERAEELLSPPPWVSVDQLALEDAPRLSERQQRNYSIVLYSLWVLLFLVILYVIARLWLGHFTVSVISAMPGRTFLLRSGRR